MINGGPEYAVPRHIARTQLRCGVDVGKVAYDLIGNCRREGLPDTAPAGILNQLRAEGFLAEETVDAGTVDERTIIVAIDPAADRTGIATEPPTPALPATAPAPCATGVPAALAAMYRASGGLPAIDREYGA